MILRYLLFCWMADFNFIPLIKYLLRRYSVIGSAHSAHAPSPLFIGLTHHYLITRRRALTEPFDVFRLEGVCNKTEGSSIWSTIWTSKALMGPDFFEVQNLFEFSNKWKQGSKPATAKMRNTYYYVLNFNPSQALSISFERISTWCDQQSGAQLRSFGLCHHCQNLYHQSKCFQLPQPIVILLDTQGRTL